MLGVEPVFELVTLFLAWAISDTLSHVFVESKSRPSIVEQSLELKFKDRNELRVETHKGCDLLLESRVRISVRSNETKRRL